MRTDRSRFPALCACRCPARPTLLGWKSVVTPKGRMTGAAVSATPTPCMHRALPTCSILVRPDSESNMPALFEGLSTCSAHTHHRSPIRATIWRLVCRRSSNTPHCSVCLAGLALHGKEPSAGGALIFRIARPARRGAQMRPSVLRRLNQPYCSFQPHYAHRRVLLCSVALAHVHARTDLHPSGDGRGWRGRPRARRRLPVAGGARAAPGTPRLLHLSSWRAPGTLPAV